MNLRGSGMDSAWVPNAIPTAGPTITQELEQLLREWKVELTHQLRKDAAAKARPGKGCE